MTASDLIAALARTNLALGAAILVVLALRGPARRLFGAHLAYGLWLLAPAAVAGSLLPGVDPLGWTSSIDFVGGVGQTWLADRARSLAALWTAGVAVNLALALWRQGRFAAAERAGRAGPATVGVIAPRMVVPADFARRYSEAERRLIRAHEMAHMDRLDCRFNALAVVAAWLCWFNPLAHLALTAFRRDQEMACDATVMRRLPGSRRAYAEAMLLGQPFAQPAVFGCHWPTEHPLAARLDMLTRRSPSQRRRDLGLAAVVGLCAASFAAAWGAQPSPRPGAAPTVIVTDLTPPDAQETAWVYRALPGR